MFGNSFITSIKSCQSFESNVKYCIGRPQNTYEIFLLPDNLLEKILGYLTYNELVRIRKVCRWFYYVIGSMLNNKFVSLKDSIDDEILLVKKRRNPMNDGYLRILNIIKSEVRILEAHCIDYIDGNMLFFYGGLILDFIDSILLSKQSSQCTHLVSELFVLVDEFLDNFDVVREPTLVKRSLHLRFSWFGKKLIDILDCYSTFEFAVSVTPEINGKYYKWVGNYEAHNISSVLDPPKLLNTVNGSQKDMFILLKYIRNHIRWNNVLNNINALSKDLDCYCTELRFKDSAMGTILYNRKALKSGKKVPRNYQSLTINMDLFCHQILAPRKFQEVVDLSRMSSTQFKEIPKISASASADEEATSMDFKNPINSTDYELNLTMEVISRGSSRNNFQVSTYQICQIEDVCYIASNTQTVK